MKVLTKGRLILRNSLRIFGLVLTIFFFIHILITIILFEIKVLGFFDMGDILFYTILYLGTIITFIELLPKDYLISYKDYLKSLEKLG